MRITDQEANRLQVLKAIRRAEPVARTELAQRIGLSTQAISDVTAELVRRNLLLEERGTSSGPGRPRSLLRINPEGARVVGAFLFPDHRLGIEIANLRGDRLFERTFSLERQESAESLAEQIGARVGEVIAASPVPRAAIHSVGLGVPGSVDSLGGVLHWLPGYPQRPSPLAELVSRRVGLPVLLDSAPDVLTRAEHWFGEDRQVDDFVLIFVGFGMGLGQYVDGLLRTGDHGMSPEFAHVKVTLGGGPVCLCGGRGCLTTYASVSGVVSRIADARGEPSAHLEQMTAALQTYIREARAGEARASEVLEFAGTALGAAVANYINIWDPARVLLQVQERDYFDIIAEPFRAALEAGTTPTLRGRAQVQIRASEEIAFSKGAAALVLEQLYRGASSSAVSVQAIAPGPAVRG